MADAANVSGLVVGTEMFRESDLFEKAATCRALTLQPGNGRPQSKPIKKYGLDNNWLAVLARSKIVRHPRDDGIFTLVDENPQEGRNPSDFWNFPCIEGKKDVHDLSVSLYVDLGIGYCRRGVVLVPKAAGSGASAADPLPNFRMFKTLVEHDNGAPDIAKMLAGSDGTLVVSWTDLGLGGIRTLRALFAEFAYDREAVLKLGQQGDMFDPCPCSGRGGDTAWYVSEPAQPKLFDQWQKQLDAYRASLGG